jgi:glycosyltransferase involved in cell wall biosynthesis
MIDPFLSVALLNYNERATVEQAARLVSEVLRQCGHTHELLLVDDGSTDGSRAIIEQLAVDLPQCRAVFHPRNLGIGAGIRSCFFEGKGQWATWFPADLQADPRELPRLLEHLPECDVLITYRDHSQRRENWKRKWISACERTLVRNLFGLKLQDLHWIRFFRRELLNRMALRSRSPFIDNEMVVAAKQLGARIREVCLLDQPRRFGVANGARWSNLASAFRDLVLLRARTLLRRSA